MRTTLALVYDALSERFVCSKGDYYKPETLVLSVSDDAQIYNPSVKSRAFIVPGDSLPDLVEEPDIPLKRVIAVVPPSQSCKKDCAFCVYAYESITEVLQVAENALRRYRSWYSHFSMSALSGASIQDLVNQAHMMLENPIIVLDKAMRISARTVNDVINDAMWDPFNPKHDEFSDEMKIEDEAPGLIELLGQLEETRTVRDHLSYNNRTLAASRTREYGGAYLFVCLIQKNRQITNTDIEVLQALCDMIEVVLKTSGKWELRESIGYGGLLVDAFEGRISNNIELQNRMHTLGRRLEEKYCIIVAVPEKGHLNDRQAHRLINDISNNYSFGECVIYNGALVFFITYEEGRGPKAYDYSKFESFLADSNMMAGVSEEFSSKVPVREAYDTAISAFNIGRKINSKERIFYFSEYRPYYPYEICMRENGYDLFIHPALKALREHDEKNRTSLYQILRCFSKNWGNRSKAAKELFIQRNTLQSRINAIEKICDVNLSDPRVLAHIYRSFGMVDYYEKSVPGGQPWM